MRPASQHFFIHSYIYLPILIISYLATFLGTNSLSVLMCRKAVNQSINQSINFDESWIFGVRVVDSKGFHRGGSRPEAVFRTSPCFIQWLKSNGPPSDSCNPSRKYVFHTGNFIENIFRFTTEVRIGIVGQCSSMIGYARYVSYSINSQLLTSPISGRLTLSISCLLTSLPGVSYRIGDHLGGGCSWRGSD